MQAWWDHVELAQRRSRRPGPARHFRFESYISLVSGFGRAPGCRPSAELLFLQHPVSARTMPKKHDIPFESTRIPIDCSIRMRFDRLSGFEEHYAANISMGGMFIKTTDIYPPGTVFEFDFELEGGEHLIKGKAEVLWRRVEERGPDRPCGIGVRFLALDLESKYVIYRLVDRYIQLGGTPFDLESPDSAGKAVPAFARNRLQRALRLAWMPAAAVAAGVFLIAIFRQGSAGETTAALDRPKPETGGVSAPKPPPAEPGVSDEQGHRPGGEATPGAPSPVEPVAAGSTEPAGATAVESAVHGWARAWSEKDLERYLDHYSVAFRPALGLTLAAWQAQRRERLSRPGPIAIEVSALTIVFSDPGQAAVRFDQAYTSASYRDRVEKELDVRLEDGAWKIVRERVLAQRRP